MRVRNWIVNEWLTHIATGLVIIPYIILAVPCLGSQMTTNTAAFTKTSIALALQLASNTYSLGGSQLTVVQCTYAVYTDWHMSSDVALSEHVHFHFCI